MGDSAAIVSVIDTGIGIAKEDQEAIFEEFRQVGSNYAHKREGTGLGLTLTRKFVELHGGKIWVESDVGKGSKFTFTLPVNPHSFPISQRNRRVSKAFLRRKVRKYRQIRNKFKNGP